MKLRILFILWAVAMLLPCSMGATTQNIRVMTYNIPPGNIPAVGINTWANRCKTLQTFLCKVHPDILGLQEPERDELMNLLSGMPGYALLGVGRDDGKEKGEYTAILYRTDHLYVEKTGTYWLSETPDVPSMSFGSTHNRIATWAIFRDTQTGSRFFYTNTHIEYKGTEARPYQMKIAKEHMEALIKEEGKMPTILTGDFNVKSYEETYKLATTYRFNMNDAWTTALATETDCDGYTFPVDKQIDGTKPYKCDYIMVSTDIKVNKAYIKSSAFPGPQFLSDHNTHYADISWTTTRDQDDLARLWRSYKLLDSTMAYKNTKEKLITNATDGNAGCQITHDGAETKEGSYVKYLIDGDQSTYFHSLGSATPPAQPHYLQIDLKRDDIKYFHFTYLRRNDSNYGVADRWQDIMITGSNDKQTWDYIGILQNFGGNEFKTFTSPTIAMSKCYRHIRFSVMHTPAEKIRNGNPQFSCAEFQIYRDTIDTQNALCCTSQVLRKECATLQRKLNTYEEALATETLTAELRKSLQTTYDSISSYLKVKYAFIHKINEAEDLLTVHTTGIKFGQTSKESRDILKEAITQIQGKYQGDMSQEDSDALLSQFQQQIDAFKQSLVKFDLDKWYYITNNHKNGNAKADEFGQVLYLGGNTTQSDSIKYGYYAKSKAYYKQNPYAMWRFVQMENGKYALLNRATGFYLGGQNILKTCYYASPTPLPYTIEQFGIEDFSFTPDGKTYLAAGSDSIVVPTQTDYGYNSASSWMIEVVYDKHIALPVRNHTISILCLPFAVSGISQASPLIQTYTLCSSPAKGVFNLEKKDSFQAGEPFFIMTGKMEELDADCRSNVTLQLPPPDDFTLEGKEVNGLFGTLDGQNLKKPSYVVKNNAIASQLGKIPGHSGYIPTTSQIADTGGTPSLTISKEGGVTGIMPVPAHTSSKPAVVYTTDGKVAGSHIMPGIYIIDGKKIQVR